MNWGFCRFTIYPWVDANHDELFLAALHLQDSHPGVRRFLSELANRIWSRKINFSKDFALTLSLD
jgi:hypothetical protein